MISKYDNFITESKLQEFISNPKIKSFFLKLKKEINETKEAKNIFIKYTKGEKITEEESKMIREQSKDILKTLGLGSVFMLPGGIMLIALLVKYGKKVGVDILPSSFKD